jgi:peptidoglycan/LPS O-acetylase OafA/YrhL
MPSGGQDFRSSYASVHLDLIRGLSALAVLFGHARGLFFVDHRELESPGILVQFVYLVSGFGHQAVMVFFVLSGYFISSTVLQSSWADRWDWRSSRPSPPPA